MSAKVHIPKRLDRKRAALWLIAGFVIGLSAAIFAAQPAVSARGPQHATVAMTEAMVHLGDADECPETEFRHHCASLGGCSSCIISTELSASVHHVSMPRVEPHKDMSAGSSVPPLLPPPRSST